MKNMSVNKRDFRGANRDFGRTLPVLDLRELFFAHPKLYYLMLREC